MEDKPLDPFGLETHYDPKLLALTYEDEVIRIKILPKKEQDEDIEDQLENQEYERRSYEVKLIANITNLLGRLRKARYPHLLEIQMDATFSHEKYVFGAMFGLTMTKMIEVCRQEKNPFLRKLSLENVILLGFHADLFEVVLKYKDDFIDLNICVDFHISPVTIVKEAYQKQGVRQSILELINGKSMQFLDIRFQSSRIKFHIFTQKEKDRIQSEKLLITAYKSNLNLKLLYVPDFDPEEDMVNKENDDRSVSSFECWSSIWILVAIRYHRNSALNIFPKEMVWAIAKSLRLTEFDTQSWCRK